MSLHTLSNIRGSHMTLDSVGAAVTGIFVHDGDDAPLDLTVNAGGSAGKAIGRYANRIARGELPIEGHVYTLLTNEGRNTLHGGPDGFSKREWTTAERGASFLEFMLHSPDGDQGFPGAMTCRVRYTWSDDDALRIDFSATTDAVTVVNLTNHSYFNLQGKSDDVSQQQLQIAASAYTPLDDELIPTGEIAPVEGTSRDFRSMRPIGHEKFDCNFVLDDWNGDLRRAARVYEAQSGRSLIVETTQPGLQLYTGKPGAFALETQHFADAPHHSNFPSTVLRPGEIFRASTVYRFARER